MPFLVLAVAPLILVLAVLVLMPVSLVQRYRMGTARRLARPWLTAINFWGIGVSTAMFLVAAAITSVWVPGAFTYALGGFAAGCALGVLGLAWSRWEAARGSLHYTPNRWLVLAITLTVSARIAYGFWRGWQAWGSGLENTSWLAASGAAGSLAAGAVVLGYYLTYWTGVRRRLRALREVDVLEARVRHAKRVH